MRCLYASLFIVMTGSFAVAEEMPLPFSSNDLTLGRQNVPTLAIKSQRHDPAQFGSPEAYSERSLLRFQRRGKYDLAQLGDEYPTDYMQEPEIDSQASPSNSSASSHDRSTVASAESPSDIPPAPGSDDLNDVPPPPSQAEIESMFGESASPAPSFSSPAELDSQGPIELQFSAPVQAATPLNVQLNSICNPGRSCTK